MHKNLKNITFEDLIISQNENYILVNKPPFIASLDDRAESKNLLSLAKEVNEDYQICHRLDKETSGIVVFAKNAEAYRNFAIQLENREVKKVYHAVIHGLHKFEDFEADEPLQTTSTKSRVDFRAGKPAFTLISTLEILKKHTLVKCFPVTGRMHQIRAHLAHHQAPIINDPGYGGEPAFLSELKRNFNYKKWEDEKPMINRVALHSFEVAFKDLDGEIIEGEAPYPKDFSVLLKLLRKFN
ncbi:23S rRNA pseudouridine955/2504/2580 synthase [Ekhidna lutea]|uniref:23S rRNA pseudouridine955/2504/2580 synthase n=1 Tax=Ekhidna lutea TaxID=447679 RepID=A0A239IZ56_EKHLU|nr:RNA pseudouridine synthase [Ekhidna lutea]SNS98907.1 23S rRNA pseudouridine955/2504/2580 synthase [Ekhidna lutea]